MKNNIEKNIEGKVDESIENDIEQNNEKEIVKTEDKFKWIKNHKKFVIGLAVTGATIGGTIAAIMNKEKIEEGISKIADVLLKNIDSELPKMAGIAKETVENVKMLTYNYTGEIPKHVKALIDGKVHTATELGDAMGCSAQDVNKHLIAAGFLEKTASGIKYLTEKGKEFGEEATRCMPWGYDASTIVWDKSVLNHIYSDEDFNHRIDVEKIIEQSILEKAQSS